MLEKKGLYEIGLLYHFELYLLYLYKLISYIFAFCLPYIQDRIVIFLMTKMAPNYVSSPLILFTSTFARFTDHLGEGIERSLINSVGKLTGTGELQKTGQILKIHLILTTTTFLLIMGPISILMNIILYSLGEIDFNFFVYFFIFIGIFTFSILADTQLFTFFYFIQNLMETSFINNLIIGKTIFELIAAFILFNIIYRPEKVIALAVVKLIAIILSVILIIYIYSYKLSNIYKITHRVTLSQFWNFFKESIKNASILFFLYFNLEALVTMASFVRHRKWLGLAIGIFIQFKTLWEEIGRAMMALPILLLNKAIGRRNQRRAKEAVFLGSIYIFITSSIFIGVPVFLFSSEISNLIINDPKISAEVNYVLIYASILESIASVGRFYEFVLKALKFRGSLIVIMTIVNYLIFLPLCYYLSYKYHCDVNELCILVYSCMILRLIPEAIIIFGSDWDFDKIMEEISEKNHKIRKNSDYSFPVHIN